MSERREETAPEYGYRLPNGKEVWRFLDPDMPSRRIAQLEKDAESIGAVGYEVVMLVRDVTITTSESREVGDLAAEWERVLESQDRAKAVEAARVKAQES